jgi:Uma2 family endonuclease
MARPTPKKFWSEAEYLGMERASTVKHEYYQGEIFAMSGASRAHNLVALGFGSELRQARKGRPCRVYPSDMRVKVPGVYTYPDVSGLCGPDRFADDQRDTLTNPSAIIEVLSASTEGYDRGDKFEMYRSIPSLVDYILASQDEVRVEHFVRQGDGSWLMRELGAGSRLEVVSLGCTVSLDEVYAGALAAAVDEG